MNVLVELERRVAKDLSLIAYPVREWVPPTNGPGGEPMRDVLVVGAGQGGIAVASRLLRERVTNIEVIDAKSAGREGPWLDYARMHTLRSPKEVTGPDLDLPSLTFQAWLEAQHGELAWQRLVKIDRSDWVEYLLWVRRMMGVPVANNVALTRIEPVTGADGRWLLRAHLRDARGERALLTRKLVLATGIDGTGGWQVPDVVARLPTACWARASEAIDFAALAGRRVAVLGAAASAFDNAATALEAGARAVHVYCRRAALQRVQPFKWISYPGFLRHFHTLDDATRWRFMHYLLTLREAFPRETWERASRHAGFVLHTGAPWRSARHEAGAVRIDAEDGTLDVDFVLVATGLDIRVSRCPLLGEWAGDVATWADRYSPPDSLGSEALGRYPYVGPAGELLERCSGKAPWLGLIHLFTFATTLSHGPSGASINAMKFAAPRVADGVVRDLFAADAAYHYDALRAYDAPEFLLPGEHGEVAPVQATVDHGVRAAGHGGD